MSVRKRKVLISCSYAGSLINFRGKLIQELVKDHEVYAFVPGNYPDRVKHTLHAWGVKVYHNNLSRNSVSLLGDVQYMVQLYRIIQAVRPDLFFAYTFKPIIYGSIVASFCRVEGICSMLTGLGYTFVKKSKVSITQELTKRLLKFSLKPNKQIKIIFQNNDDLNQLLASRIIDEKNKAFVVNGSGVDLTHFHYDIPDTRTITFLMMARLIRAKGVEEFFNAAVKIKSKYPHVRFRYLGSEDKGIDCIDPELLERIKSNQVIEYGGSVPDVRPFIRESSVVVLPSYYGEGTPRSLLEAMAIGRAILTSNAAGCRETVNPDPERVNGFAIPPRDADALAEKMEYYILNPDKIMEHGYHGRLYAEDRYDVNKVNEQMLQIFDLNP
ncbi:MAG TPA: glycosyltransferase family 4 protein [Sphingobacteriaceae bacterium]